MREIHGVARGTLAFVFLYHGLVTKILARDPVEFAMVEDAGIPPATALRIVLATGALEVGLALSLLLLWRRAWPDAAIVVLMPLLALGVAVVSPRLLTGAFNPVSFNLSVAALAVVDLLSVRELGRAARLR